MCVFLRKWKANQLPGTQGIWFLKWSNADCHSSTRCEGWSSVKNGKAGFQAHCCAGPTPPWAASSESIFLLAGCRKPSTARLFCDPIRTFPGLLSAQTLECVCVGKFGRLVKIIRILISTPAPAERRRVGFKSQAVKLAKRPILRKPLFYTLLFTSCAKKQCLLLRTSPPPFLWLLSLFTDIFNTRQYKELFPHINSKCHKEQNLVPTKPD